MTTEEQAAAIYRQLMDNPMGGFARLLRNHITPCRACEWTAAGEIKQLCGPHLNDVKTAHNYRGRRF